MSTDRMETFSDGVIAILLTIMVLELKVPAGEHLDALNQHHLWPTFFSYILSFVTIGIYWNNHHHMLRATERINGAILWANLHLLFWLSLFSFATGWMGENHFARTPTAVYGVVLLCAGIAYYILQTLILRELGPGSALSVALGRDLKGKMSPVIYTAGIVLTFANRWLGVAAYAVVALMWLVPDRRLAPTIADSGR
jgi:uncharacterized membrane protein